MNEVYKDFILIIGIGRSGTTVCSGLLDQHPLIKMGYEVNNKELYAKNLNPFYVLAEFPEEFNANKIAFNSSINSPYNSDLVIKCINKRKCIISNDFKDLHIIFTNRNIIDLCVSTWFRFINKGIMISKKRLVCNIIRSSAMLEKIKESIKNYFVFEFSKMDDLEYINSMFSFCNLEFSKTFVTKYKSSAPYAYYSNLSIKNIQYGATNKFPEERREFEEILISSQFKIKI